MTIPPLNAPERIDGDGIYLRRFSLSDIDAVCATAADPESFRGFSVPTDGNRDTARKHIELLNRMWDVGVIVSYAIVDAATEQTVGLLQAGVLHYPSGRVTLGYWVLPQFRRQGYSSRSLSAMLEWLRTTGHVARAEAFVELWNTASCAVLGQAGFEREGILRNWERIVPKTVVNHFRPLRVWFDGAGSRRSPAAVRAQLRCLYPRRLPAVRFR